MSTALAKRQNTTTLAARQQTHAPDDDVASASLRSGALLCDAMGYQEPVDPAAEQAAQQLVEEELRQNPGAPPRLPALRPPRDSSIMAAEFSRCDRDEDLAPLAIERYSCAPPTEQDPEAWKSARTNVRAQLEHQANRVVNLELAESFSEHTWRRHVHDLGRLHAQVAALAEGKEREAEQINLKRKRDQAKLGPDIVRAERAVVERLERHRALEARVAALRKEEARRARRSAWPPPLSRVASLMAVFARRFEVLAGATRRREGGAARGELGAAPAEKQSTPR